MSADSVVSSSAEFGRGMCCCDMHMGYDRSCDHDFPLE